MCKMIIERRLRDAQFGFIPDRERGGGCNIRGAATYGETGKACDRVPRQEVWMRIGRIKGLPDNYVMKPMHMGSEEITLSGGNEGVKMDERNYQAGQNYE